MVAMYTVAGRQVGSHVLAMATLGTAFAGAYLAFGGSSSKEKKPTPPINATSTDEEKFIKDFLQSAEASSKEKH